MEKIQMQIFEMTWDDTIEVRAVVLNYSVQ